MLTDCVSRTKEIVIRLFEELSLTLPARRLRAEKLNQYFRPSQASGIRSSGAAPQVGASDFSCCYLFGAKAMSAAAHARSSPQSIRLSECPRQPEVPTAQVTSASSAMRSRLADHELLARDIEVRRPLKRFALAQSATVLRAAFSCRLLDVLGSICREARRWPGPSRSTRQKAETSNRP